MLLEYKKHVNRNNSLGSLVRFGQFYIFNKRHFRQTQQKNNVNVNIRRNLTHARRTNTLFVQFFICVKSWETPSNGDILAFFIIYNSKKTGQKCEYEI